MINLPILDKFNGKTLEKILKHFPSIKFISKERRENFSADFPMHTRYFSNGDVPLIALVKHAGTAIINYNKQVYDMEDGCVIFFDDSEPHSWQFGNSQLDICYYRCGPMNSRIITTGDYCLDEFFES